MPYWGLQKTITHNILSFYFSKIAVCGANKAYF